MEVIATKNQIRELALSLKKKSKTVAFVPTMGFLHEGHLALIKRAKELADIVIVSIFVNKSQFNEQNDFLEYPRDIESDAEKLLSMEVDYLFTPSDEDIYCEDEGGFEIVAAKKYSDILCGKYRKGHFSGVCNILMKLFNLINPDFAVFGLKDYQQYFLVKKMVEFYDLVINIQGVDTIRESDGVAMSSRNSNLSDDARMVAAKIYQNIRNIKLDVKNSSNINYFLQNRIKELENSYQVQFDYLDIRSQEDLQLITDLNNQVEMRLFWAYKVGNVRLIDNFKF